MNEITNAMTVDVEDYFQVSAFEDHVDRNNWDNMDSRIERNIELILSKFSEYNVTATFFVLGWIAERYPQMIKNIVESGHEIASHGYSHTRVTQQNQGQFREDVVTTKKLLEDIGGTSVQGYRAASYSINGSNHSWAHKELELAGHKYSSSIYPIKHDLYGIPDASRYPYKPGNGEFLEIPISTYQCLGKRFPCGGGGFFRLFPYKISKAMINSVNKNEKQPCVFYFHPWELDVDQPVVSGLNIKTRFRHYLNLNRMENRLEQLLKDFKWNRIDAVYL
jgi:polysaccharide deacetylase family protein (PEP-CTERM system associated)